MTFPIPSMIVDLSFKANVRASGTDTSKILNRSQKTHLYQNWGMHHGIDEGIRDWDWTKGLKAIGMWLELGNGHGLGDQGLLELLSMIPMNPIMRCCSTLRVGGLAISGNYSR